MALFSTWNKNTIQHKFPLNTIQLEYYFHPKFEEKKTEEIYLFCNTRFF